MIRTLTTKGQLAFITKKLDSGKAEHILTLDIREVSSMADFMVIATGTSTRHVMSLGHHLADDLKAKNIRPLNDCDKSDGNWVVVDLGAIIVHILTEEARNLYNLEELWHVSKSKRNRTKSRKSA